MSNVDIVRAWKDIEYRQSLSVEEQARLPEHPSGAIELADEELDQAVGGISQGFTDCNTSCTGFTEICWCTVHTTILTA